MRPSRNRKGGNGNPPLKSQCARALSQPAKSILHGKELIIGISGMASADPLGLELLSCMRNAGGRLTADLPPASMELLRQLDVPTLAPRSESSLLAGIWRRWLASGVQGGQAAIRDSRS